MRRLTLAQLSIGDEAVVAELEGGHNMIARLEAMGIRPGTRLRVTGGPRGGPITVRAGASQIAVGRGMAGRIFLKTDKPEKQ